jgi:hypothetical protein
MAARKLLIGNVRQCNVSATCEEGGALQQAEEIIQTFGRNGRRYESPVEENLNIVVDVSSEYMRTLGRS